MTKSPLSFWAREGFQPSSSSSRAPTLGPQRLWMLERRMLVRREGVIQRNRRPKSCFWRVHLVLCPLEVCFFRDQKRMGMAMFKRTFARTIRNNLRAPHTKMWVSRPKRGRKFTRTSPRTLPWNFIAILSAPPTLQIEL